MNERDRRIVAWLRSLERTASSGSAKGAYGYAADGIERGEFLGADAAGK